MSLTEILAVSGVRAIVRMCVKVIVGGCSVQVCHLVSNPDCYKVHSSFPCCAVPVMITSCSFRCQKLCVNASIGQICVFRRTVLFI